MCGSHENSFRRHSGAQQVYEVSWFPTAKQNPTQCKYPYTHPNNTRSCSFNRTCSPSWLHQLKRHYQAYILYTHTPDQWLFWWQISKSTILQINGFRIWTWKKLVLKPFSKHTLWWNQINNWKDQHYYIANGKVDAKFSFLKSLVYHMIVSSCSSSSDPIRCSHIIWKERYSRSSQGDSDFRLLTCLFIFQLQCSSESIKKLRWTHVISTCKGSWKLKHNDLFQAIFSISHVNLKTSSSAFFFFFLVKFCQICVKTKIKIKIFCYNVLLFFSLKRIAKFWKKKNCWIFSPHLDCDFSFGSIFY